ncbi:hypothetical protein MMC18_002785 [Xylographa bjoerkii]|nr:hypothetical protein [Xylographa bjoerkii]
MSRPTRSLFTHTGPFSPHLRLSPALLFLEAYGSHVDARDLSMPYSDFYVPDAIFYDTIGAVYRSGDAIWTWMKSLFVPFDSVTHEGVILWCCGMTKAVGLRK